MKLYVAIDEDRYCFNIPLIFPPGWLRDGGRWPGDDGWWPGGDLDLAQQTDKGIDPRVMRDMTTLAIINMLSKQLTPGSQDFVSGGVKAAADQLALPKGITVGF